MRGPPSKNQAATCSPDYQYKDYIAIIGHRKWWANEVRSALREAVRVTAEGCVPERTGAYLSGGTDSSTVVAFLDEYHPPASSFSVWFDDPRYSEIGFARATAQAFRTRHFERCVSPEDAEESIPKIIEYYDEPFANSSAVGAYWCARMAQEQGMEILLAGDGGDELFAGNERYAADKVFQLYDALPPWLRRRWIEPVVNLLPEGSRARRFGRRARIPNPRRMLSRSLFLSMQPGEVFGPGFRELRRWEKRYIFKQSMKGTLPKSVLYKKKHGFGVPLGKWLLHNRRLNSLVVDVLSDSGTRQRGYFCPAFLDRLMELHRGEHAAYYGELIWYLLVLELWHRVHLERAIRVPVGN